MNGSLKIDGQKKGEHLVSVETTDLKNRLNSLYRLRAKAKIENTALDHLWDVKELALLERKQTVEVPGSWLDELDGIISTLAK